jgi:hypothetical protein
VPRCFLDHRRLTAVNTPYGSRGIAVYPMCGPVSGEKVKQASQRLGRDAGPFVRHTRRKQVLQYARYHNPSLK